MRALITGATGFIGRHLAIRLVEELDTEVSLLVRDQYAAGSLPAPLETIRSQLTVFYADLRDFEQVQRALNQLQPDIIFHLAAAGVADPFLTVEDALSHNLTAL